MIIFGAYFSILSYRLKKASDAYGQSKAPAQLKKLRHALSLATLGCYTGLGFYSAHEESLWLLLIFSRNAAATLLNIPVFFLAMVVASSLLKAVYSIRKILNTEQIDFYFKLKSLWEAVCNFSFIAAITLSVTTPLIPISSFGSLMFGYLVFKKLVPLMDTLFFLYERKKLGKVIDWEYLTAKIYFGGTVVFLLILSAVHIFTLSQIMLDAIICLNAAAYLLSKSLFDYQSDYKITKKIGLQLSISFVQSMVGISLITGALMVPQTMGFSFVLLVLIKSLSIIPASDLIEKHQKEEAAIGERADMLMQENSSSPLASCSTYGFFSSYFSKQYQCAQQAKQEILVDAVDTVPHLSHGDDFNTAPDLIACY